MLKDPKYFVILMPKFSKVIQPLEALEKKSLKLEINQGLSENIIKSHLNKVQANRQKYKTYSTLVAEVLLWKSKNQHYQKSNNN